MPIKPETLLFPDGTLADAIRTIDKGGHRIAVVVDAEEKLLGIITDFDIRKAILKGADLQSSLEPHINRDPIMALAGTPREVLKKMMIETKKDQIPLVNADGRVVGLETVFSLMDEELKHDLVAVIMAGGKGTRLKPLTLDAPKSLLPIQDKPLLEIILRELKRHYVSTIYVSINYFGSTIRESMGDGKKLGLNIAYLEEEEPLGTAGALSLLPEKPQQPFIVMNGDLLTKVDFSSLLRYHTQSNSRMTVCVRKHATQIPYGVVEIKDSRLISVQEKPTHTHFVNAGIYVLDPQVIDLIPKGERFDMTELIAALLKAGAPIGSFPIHEYWLDIGQKLDYDKAHEEYERYFAPV